MQNEKVICNKFSFAYDSNTFGIHDRFPAKTRFHALLQIAAAKIVRKTEKQFASGVWQVRGRSCL